VPAARALSAFLEEFYPQGVWMIFAAMADKQIQPMLDVLEPHTRQVIFTRVQNDRAKDPKELSELIPESLVEPTVAAAIDRARTIAPPQATILICGSLYLVGEARSLIWQSTL
jgi:dihydrofolate synthase/folylpolyglutamate synthase